MSDCGYVFNKLVIIYICIEYMFTNTAKNKKIKQFKTKIIVQMFTI